MKLKNLFFITSSFIIGFGLFILMLYKYDYLDFQNVFPNEAATIYSNCNDHMKHNVCAIMTSNVTFLKDVQQIYLPTIGPIKADIYRNLLNAGFQMCNVIREHCEQSLKSEVCQIGQVLYSQK